MHAFLLALRVFANSPECFRSQNVLGRWSFTLSYPLLIYITIFSLRKFFYSCSSGYFLYAITVLYTSKSIENVKHILQNAHITAIPFLIERILKLLTYKKTPFDKFEMFEHFFTLIYFNISDFIILLNLKETDFFFRMHIHEKSVHHIARLCRDQLL